MVSKWFWLYWVVTVFLTVVLLAAFFYTSGGMEKKIKREFENKYSNKDE
jgi:hypothetical protein